jgi:hypothetical protein
MSLSSDYLLPRDARFLKLRCKTPKGESGHRSYSEAGLSACNGGFARTYENHPFGGGASLPLPGKMSPRRWCEV